MGEKLYGNHSEENPYESNHGTQEEIPEHTNYAL